MPVIELELFHFLRQVFQLLGIGIELGVFFVRGLGHLVLRLQDGLFLREILAADGLGALEHHVFQHVGKTGFALGGVLGPDGLHIGEGDDRNARFLHHQNLEAVTEVFFNDRQVHSGSRRSFGPEGVHRKEEDG